MERPVGDPAWSATRTRSGASRPKTTVPPPRGEARTVGSLWEPKGTSPGEGRRRPGQSLRITQTPARNGDLLRHLGRDRNL